MNLQYIASVDITKMFEIDSFNALDKKRILITWLPFVKQIIAFHLTSAAWKKATPLSQGALINRKG